MEVSSSHVRLRHHTYDVYNVSVCTDDDEGRRTWAIYNDEVTQGRTPENLSPPSPGRPTRRRPCARRYPGADLPLTTGACSPPSAARPGPLP